MCGIFGFSRLTDVTRRMAPMLAWEMEDRGHDSWGVTNGHDTVKRLGMITKTWRTVRPLWSEWDRAIFHTRAASTGAVTLENQHPFEIVAPAKDGTPERHLVGIHNGVVMNHSDLNTKHDRHFDCDTPHIFSALAGLSPTNEIHGYGNLAWYEWTEAAPTPLLHLLHFNAGNLNIAKLTSGEVVFCSLKDPIDRAASYAGSGIDKHFFTEGDKLYTVGLNYEDVPGSDMLIQGPKVPFGGRSVQSHTPIPWVDGRNIPGLVNRNSGYNNSTSIRHTNVSELGSKDRVDNICLVNACKNKVKNTRRRELICEEHLRDITRAIETQKLLSDRIAHCGGAE